MNPIELAKELLRLHSEGSSREAQDFQDRHALTITQALLDAEADKAEIQGYIEEQDLKIRRLESEIERLTKSREGSIK